MQCTMPTHSDPGSLLTAPWPADAVLAGLWRGAGLPDDSLQLVDLPGGNGPVLPSSFNVASAAQAGLAAAALAAVQLGQRRGQSAQRVAVDRTHATLECSAHFAIDGVVPPLWDPVSGLYPCGGAVGQPGHVRIHANFAHHRDGALRLLGLPPGADTTRAQVAEALRHWSADGFEDAAAQAGLVVAAARSFAQWDAHPQGQALAGQPVLQITRIGDAPPLPWPALAARDRPLTGLRVLDLTRILAGPVAGRCLAAYGADVLMVNGPHLPNIDAIADLSRGKLSALVDLRDDDGRAILQRLVQGAHVFLQGYRPGGLAGRGFGAEALTALRPGIVVAELSAYGDAGPWAGRRGFDSLVQTATGFNWAEGDAAGHDQVNQASQANLASAPKALPVQILDFSAGHLLALGIQAALWRQANQGGSWRVAVSLAGVGHWLRGLGRVAGGLACTAPPLAPYLDESPSGFGLLRAMRHAPQFSATPAAWPRPAMPPGSHAPAWP